MWEVWGPGFVAVPVTVQHMLYMPFVRQVAFTKQRVMH